MIKTIIANPPNITIMFDDGGIYTGNCTREQALYLSENLDMSQDDTIAYLDPKVKEVVEKNKAVDKVTELVIQDERYFYIDNSLYRKGIKLSIPINLAADIASCIEGLQNADNTEDQEFWTKSLEKLDKFWLWTSLIRNPEVRESFYTYVQNNKLVLVDEGFTICFRKANFKGNKAVDKPFVDFISEHYLRLKKAKKGTGVMVYKEDGKYNLKSGTTIGTLKDLYTSLGEKEELSFESNQTGIDGKRMIYRIGKESRLPEDEVDWDPSNECSRGLHLHLGKYDDNSYGETRLICAINPMHVASCPYADHTKFRVQAVTPIGILNPNTKIEDFLLTPEIEEVVSEMFASQVAQMEELLEGNNPEEFKKHSLQKEIIKATMEEIVSTMKGEVIVKERHKKLN